MDRNSIGIARQIHMSADNSIQIKCNVCNCKKTDLNYYNNVYTKDNNMPGGRTVR